MLSREYRGCLIGRGAGATGRRAPVPAALLPPAGTPSATGASAGRQVAPALPFTAPGSDPSEAAGGPGSAATGATRGLVTAAISAGESQLGCLSLVLDAALSILYARAAVANLISHLASARAASAGASRISPPPATGPALAPRARAWSSSQDAQHGGTRTPSVAGDASRMTTADEDPRGRLEDVLGKILADGGCQRLLVGVTRALVAR